jgi:hypothetical protein
VRVEQHFEIDISLIKVNQNFQKHQPGKGMKVKISTWKKVG